MSTTKASETLADQTVSNWLKDLRMECYKKNLEDYDTIKALLELREADIKKLGVVNSKDRTTMMNSLASFRPAHQETLTQSPGGSVAQLQQESKSLLRKGSLRKLNIKSLLGSGSSKKNKNSKKVTESVRVTEIPSTEPSEENVTPTPHTTLPPPPPSSTPHQVVVKKTVSSVLADYEELPDAVSPLFRSMTMESKSFQVPRHPAVENEYVPSPENSPQFGTNQRLRANTVATSYNPEYPQRGSVVPHLTGSSVNSNTQESSQLRQQLMDHLNSTDEDSPNQLRHKHLSVISMESGLSFGYDVEKDFNPSHPLDNQPWFHGKIPRADAEALLHEDGDFIVRENTTMSNTYTLTLRWRGVADHTLIGTTEVISTTSLLRGSTVKYQFDSGAFDSIPELIYNHLKYQIPIDINQHTLIITPICRPNTGKGGIYTNMGTYAPIQRSNFSPESSPTTGGNVKRRSGSPNEAARNHYHHMLRLGKPISLESHSRTAPRDRLSKHLSSSSGDLLEASKEEVEVTLRNVISPPPDTRGRSMTMSHPAALRYSSSSTGSQSHDNSVTPQPGASSGHERMDSFGDYEVMESVSILSNTSSPLAARKMMHQSSSHQASSQQLHNQGPSPDYYRRPQSMSAGNTLDRPPREKVKYAEIRYPRNANGAPNGRGVIVSSGSNTINYAEVRFPRSKSTSNQPHPFSTYDTVPSGRREATPPSGHDKGSSYQSRAEILAQRLQIDPAYSVPNPSASKHKSNYVTIQFPQQNPTPSTHGHTSSAATSTSQVPITQTDTTLYALPDKRKMNRATSDLGSSKDSLLSSASGSSSPGTKHVVGSSLIHSHVPSAKVHRNLPGYEALVKAHTILQNHSNDELAYHITRTDAVSFMLSPRPGEDQGIWKDRIKQVTSSSGMFNGLQMLADPDGEKLWKKLYFRHLNLSQTVTLTVVTAGDALERTKLLRRFIEVAQLLQSQKYGNLFSFIAIMQGIAAPQLKDMAEVWSLLNSHFPEDAATYKTLQSTITAIDQGKSILPHEHLTIPPIQHLKAVFHFTDQNMIGFVPIHQDNSIVGEYTNLTSGLEALRIIIANTTQFTVNAWRKLRDLKYHVSLMEFFMQDFTRVYLQSISVHSDDPLERRRRFGLLMDALIDRVESSESV